MNKKRNKKSKAGGDVVCILIMTVIASLTGFGFYAVIEFILDGPYVLFNIWYAHLLTGCIGIYFGIAYWEYGDIFGY